MRRSENKIGLLGIGEFSDLYPTNKLRRDFLLSYHSEYVIDLTLPRSTNKEINNSNCRRLIGIFRLSINHIWSFYRYIKVRPNKVFIFYPAILLSSLFSIVPKRFRPQITIDGFISIYDTVVNDRQLVSKNNVFARILKWLEYRAFSVAESIVVDTDENASFYADMYSLDLDRFKTIPLCIPKSDYKKPPQKKPPKDSVVCLYMGTFVPLHGVKHIVEAAFLLRDESNIKFELVGNGQEAPLIDQYLSTKSIPNLVWQRETISTLELHSKISNADICLGIFSENHKTRRVIPYKVYHYLANGRPLITANSPPMRSLINDDQFCIQLSKPGDANDLAEKILAFSRAPLHVRQKAQISALETYDDHLSNQYGFEILENTLGLRNS